MIFWYYETLQRYQISIILHFIIQYLNIFYINTFYHYLLHLQQISTHEADDKLFFDLEEDDTPSLSRLQSRLDAQNAPLVDEGWFHQGVSRVRRELSRLFGNERKSAKAVKRKLTKRQQSSYPRQHSSDDYESDAGSGDGDTATCK